MKRQQAGLLDGSANPLLQSSLSPVSNPMASFSSYLSIFEVTLPHHHGNPEKLGWGGRRVNVHCLPLLVGCQQDLEQVLQLPTTVGGAGERRHIKPPAGKV